MRKSALGFTVLLFLLSTTGGAQAFDCGNRFAEAEKAIAEATAAMEKVSDTTAKGLVHSLIDDAKMLLVSGKHHHAKPAAGKFDHGRAMAKADSAAGYARAATVLAGKS